MKTGIKKVKLHVRKNDEVTVIAGNDKGKSGKVLKVFPQTGRVIVETFRKGKLDPAEIPGVLVANHGPFTWGDDPSEAVERALVLEQLARMELTQRLVAPDAPRPDAFLVEKHVGRKHGKDAYYGQP